jgi:ankyrin repeat protein
MLLQAGHTPLHEAANKGHVEVVKILLEAGATVDAKTKVLRLDSPCISQLLTTPVDLQSGQTPLHYASAQGHTAVVKLLLDSGADVMVIWEVRNRCQCW